MASRRSAVILADDLTGAADSAVALAGSEGTAEVLLNHGPLSAADAAPTILSLDLHTRGMAAPQAMERVASSGRAAHLSGRRIFKKLDSTLRGHIGAELAALASVVEPDALFLVAAAHPDLGRTMIDGGLRVHGVAAEGPPLLAQLESSGFVCQHLGLFNEEAPTAWQAAWSRAAGRRERTALVCDARSMADLRRVVQASEALDRPVICVGSGGLAQAMAPGVPAPHARLGQDGAVPDMPAAGGRLFVVGSHAPVARAQVDALRQSGLAEVIDLTLEDLHGVAHGGPTVSRTSARMERAIRNRRDVVLRPSPELHVTPANGSLVAQGLARWAERGVPSASALVICGGDTGRALFDRLGVQRMVVRAWTEVGTTLAATPTLPGLPIALKAGAFGDAHLLTRLGEPPQALVRPNGVPTH